MVKLEVNSIILDRIEDDSNRLDKERNLYEITQNVNDWLNNYQM